MNLVFTKNNISKIIFLSFLNNIMNLNIFLNILLNFVLILLFHFTMNERKTKILNKFPK
jgi:hypothetical protein